MAVVPSRPHSSPVVPWDDPASRPRLRPPTGTGRLARSRGWRTKATKYRTLADALGALLPRCPGCGTRFVAVRHAQRVCRPRCRVKQQRLMLERDWNYWEVPDGLCSPWLTDRPAAPPSGPADSRVPRIASSEVE